MRAILVDWLVEVSQEYKLVSETLFLAINYIDRFLSQGAVPRRKLQLVGITCMLIAAKYEEIYAPQIDEFCYITDNTYTRDEMLAMEQQVHRTALPRSQNDSCRSMLSPPMIGGSCLPCGRQNHAMQCDVFMKSHWYHCTCLCKHHHEH